MVILRNMGKEEFPAYCQCFIDEYSQELTQNYGHTMDDAIELAKKDLHRCFPNGPESDENSLLCIEADIDGKPDVVGYLWHAINIEDESTFICDFYISDGHRSQGYGKEAISVLERQLQPIGIKQIKLRVAYHNERALKLYQKAGFSITGINMSKMLGKTPA